jgi:CTP:molybdopterin cytidylyltransferase MocA
MPDQANHIEKKTAVSAIVLAGGWSQRMNFPKLLLPYDHSVNFIQKIASSYNELNIPVVIVINYAVNEDYKNELNHLPSNCRLVVNRYPEKGRVYSIQCGINECNSEKIFIQNSDNPFTDVKLLRSMLEKSSVNGFVSPVFERKGGHPVLICGETVRRLSEVRNEEITLKDFLKNEKGIRTEAENNLISININTAEEYRKYFGDDLYEQIKSKMHAAV